MGSHVQGMCSRKLRQASHMGAAYKQRIALQSFRLIIIALKFFTVSYLVNKVALGRELAVLIAR
jgi:hypothetical protein